MPPRQRRRVTAADLNSVDELCRRAGAGTLKAVARDLADELNLDCDLALQDAREQDCGSGILVSFSDVALVVNFPFAWDELCEQVRDLESQQQELLQQLDADHAAAPEMENEHLTPSPTLTLQRSPEQTLHLVRGAPWKEALGAYLAGEGETDKPYWEAPDAYSKGDLLLTVLDTKPRTILCLERARRASGGRNIHIEDQVDLFPEPIGVSALEARLGRRLPSAPHSMNGKLADDVLAAVEAELASPTPWIVEEGKRSASTTRDRSSGLQALVLSRCGGVCPACERDFAAVLGGAGIVGLQVHHLDGLGESPAELVKTSPERLTAVCAGCHLILHSHAHPTVQELMYAWRPACPACQASQTARFIYGMPVGPDVPDGYLLGGCVVGPELPDWSCGSCSHQWSGSTPG